MQKNSNEANKARTIALLLFAALIVLAALFLKEYSHTKDASILGRVPLMAVVLVACGYYTLRYLKLKK